MNIYAWIGLGIVVVSVILPLFKKEHRTKWAAFQAVWTVLVVGTVIIFVVVLDVNLFLAMISAVLALLFSERKIYSKKGLIGVFILLIIMIAGYYFTFRDDPQYVSNYLKRNPESSSFYVTKNGEDLISYQIEAQRPLASTVKIVIAVEYAHQVADGNLDEEEKVPLSKLERFYLEGTDGGAQPAWLEAMREAGLIQDGWVSLHQVAKGMITYSSNANTEYLMDLLGLESINKRIWNLGLEQHGPIYPLSSALLISHYTGKNTPEELMEMSDEEYQMLALDIHNELKSGEDQLKDKASNLSLKMQRVWSDRMPRATAADYQRLMAVINQREIFSHDVQLVVDNLMEWPMEIHASNREKFLHFGAKGGSTAFVLNQALYVEDLSNNKMEIILFTDNLSLWQSLKLERNLDSFLLAVIENPGILEKIRVQLDD